MKAIGLDKQDKEKCLAGTDEFQRFLSDMKEAGAWSMEMYSSKSKKT
jgi:hypothetical protein